MDIYENIVIGNFLYGLGFQLGAGSKGLPHEMAVNLLQQTPLDRPLGDVLIEGASVFRLIEFKRRRNSSDKERAKHWHIRQTLSARPYLADYGLRWHWYVETEVTDRFRSYVRPYLHLLDASRNGTLEAFIQNTANEALSSRDGAKERELFHEYVGHLLRITAYSGEGSGALVFTAGGGDGRTPRFAAVRDIRDLGKLDREVINAYWKADLAQRNEVEAPRQDLAQTQGRGRGRSLSRDYSFEL